VVTDLRDLYVAYIDAANRRDFDRIREYTHDPMTTNGVSVTQDEMIADFRGHTEAIPDLRWEIQDLVIEGDRIAARLLDTGTPTKAWLGLEPTGFAVTFVECAFYRIRDGRIEASWYLMDADSVRQQLQG
jgi:predicted ester cyclase